MTTSVTSNRDHESLEREADAKRANLNRTLNAVEQRFSPDQLMQQTVDYFGEHGGDIAQSVSRSVKANALPLLLTGVGLAWLISTQSRSSSSYRGESGYLNRLTAWDEENRSENRHRAYARTNGPKSDRGYAGGSESSGNSAHHTDEDSMLDGAERTMDDMSRSVVQWREDVQKKLQSVKQEVGETAEQWQDRVINTSVEQAESLSDQYRQARHEMTVRAREQAQSTKNWMKEQPLVAGALGVAAGALIGALLPSSKVEDEIVGDRADTLKSTFAQRAESAGDDVASSIADTAQTLRQKGEEQLQQVKSKDSHTESA